MNLGLGVRSQKSEVRKGIVGSVEAFHFPFSTFNSAQRAAGGES